MAPSRQPIDIPSFAAAQIALLDAELQAEIGETSALVSNHSPTGLQNAGVALINLVVSNRRTGPGGKTVLELGRDPAMAPPAGNDDDGRAGGGLPEHGLRPGDIVLVSDQPAGSAKKREIKELEKNGVRGVVSKRGRDLVSVVLDGEEGEGALAGRVWIVKLADDVTYRRMSQTMERLMKMDPSGYSSLIQTLFGLTSPSAVPADLGSDPELADLEWIDPTLNDSQKEAVRFALASREIAIIHGPPGTGKTHTLIEVILQMVRRGLRLLVCGPSNISVDNIVERLSAHKHVPITRLGHPARLLPSVLTRSLDVLTRTSEAGAIVRDVRAEMDAKLASIKKTRNGREKRQILADVRDLRHEYRDRERRCVGDIIGGSKVVLATLHGAGGSHLRPERFDVVIIDEASQALEAQCWVPLLAAKKAICAGDHLQLPPTVKSTGSRGKKSDTKKSDANDKAPSDDNTKGMSLETTLLDRLLALHGPSIKRMLTTQYRMHQEIMRFPSAELYESKLVAADAVKGRLLMDLPYQVQHSEDTSEPLIFIDTQGGNFPETNNNEEDLPDRDGGGSAKRRGRGLHGESKSNQMEAALVGQQVRRLTDAGVMPADIAVITPYNGQLALLAPLKERYPGLEIGSVDGFQGREKEAVIISLVRSNGRGDVGFLAEKRRLNGADAQTVAMTRPRRSLTVIGDSETAKKGSKFLKRWMEFLEDKADLRYPDVADLTSET